jgi:CheY-like chemotaxis protein
LRRGIRKPGVRKVSSGPAAGPTVGGGKLLETLLYVEDDDENWDVAEYRLGNTYTMVRAATSEEACQQVRQRGRAVSAILMDIELRGSELNGIELTELFRGKRPAKTLPDYAVGLPTYTSPIVFVTAHGARYSDVELMLFGADRVIPKPVNFQALTLALQSIQFAGRTR